jgi:uncharacterized membrane protein
MNVYEVLLGIVAVVVIAAMMRIIMWDEQHGL